MNYLKLSEDTIQSCLADIEKKLRTAAVTEDVTFKIERTQPKVDKATLVLEPMAYYKMRALVTNSDKEVGWHGYTHRDGNKFYVDDIVLFPQVVTAATVTPDEKKYVEWVNGLTDEEYNTMHFHGHSHVNMGVNPSTTDTTYYETKVRTCEDYYIFIIMNKKDDINVRIYDFTENIFYDTKDVEVVRPTDVYTNWAKEQDKQFVDEIVPTHETYPVYYGGYYDRFYGNYSTYSQSTIPGTEKKSKKKQENKKKSEKLFKNNRLQTIWDYHRIEDIRKLDTDEAQILTEYLLSDEKAQEEWSDEEYNLLVDIAFESLK